MSREIYKDLDNLYENIESLNNKIRKQKRELELAYKGIEQLNNIIHNAIEYLDMVKELAKVDKINILSISTLENILKGIENENIK